MHVLTAALELILSSSACVASSWSQCVACPGTIQHPAPLWERRPGVLTNLFVQFDLHTPGLRSRARYMLRLIKQEGLPQNCVQFSCLVPHLTHAKKCLDPET